MFMDRLLEKNQVEHFCLYNNQTSPLKPLVASPVHSVILK